jgi:hypothetical protein
MFAKTRASSVEGSLRVVGNFCTVDPVWRGMRIEAIVEWSAIMPIGGQANWGDQ